MYILASQSPRRNELLSQIISEFKVIPSNINENIKVNTPEELPLMLSKLKAEEIFKTHQDDTIIAAETIVVLGTDIYFNTLKANPIKNPTKLPIKTSAGVCP